MCTEVPPLSRLVRLFLTPYKHPKHGTSERLICLHLTPTLRACTQLKPSSQKLWRRYLADLGLKMSA